jgi:hypothetical protein
MEQAETGTQAGAQAQAEGGIMNKKTFRWMYTYLFVFLALVALLQDLAR